MLLFKVILHQFWVKKFFPWKFNMEYGGTFTKLFMHVSSRNMFPTTRTNFSFAIILMWYTRNIYIYIIVFINWTLRMSDNLPERVQILCHAHFICITVLEHIIICYPIFFDLLWKSAFEWIFNVMQLILVKIEWHIKWNI